MSGPLTLPDYRRVRKPGPSTADETAVGDHWPPVPTSPRALVPDPEGRTPGTGQGSSVPPRPFNQQTQRSVYYVPRLSRIPWVETFRNVIREIFGI